MKYPCGVIKDLLPLYIDDVCNEESRQAVEKHLAECVSCKACYEAMKTEGTLEKGKEAEPKDAEIVTSLKNVKKKINGRIKIIALLAAAVILICTGGYHLLFNVPIKDVPLEEVSIFANVYAVADLIENEEGQVQDTDTPMISADEDDESGPIAVRIPEIGNEIITISANVAEKYQYLSVISLQSNYRLGDVTQERIEDTIYISSIKTTILNNKTTGFQENICGLEFGETNKIVFVDNDGAETILWSR